MAELVNLRMEYTLPELEEMERVKLFTAAEIRRIIKKRTSMEYKLRRREKTKEYFLNYIMYEINLLDLVKERRNRLLIDVKKAEIDDSIAHRINRLFKNAISRFQEDEKLWLDQIEFLKKVKWFNLVGVVYKRLLQVHAKKPSLWLKASNWLLEHENDHGKSRELLKKGLVHNPTSEILWLELFNVELLLSTLALKKKELQNTHSEKEIVEDDDPVLNGNEANSVYDNAVESIQDPEFALSFIETCMKFDIGERHIEHIFDDVQRRFPKEEVVLDAVAKKPLLFQEKTIQNGKEFGKSKKMTTKEISKEVRANYEELLKDISTEKMWDFYIAHILSMRDCAKEKQKSKMQEQCLDVMERAAAANCLSLNYTPLWIQFLFESGHEDRCLNESLSAARKWKSVDLWTQCLTYHIRCLKDCEHVYALLMEALDSAEEDALPLWKLGIEWLSLSSPDKLMDLFEKGINSEANVSIPLKEMYFTCAMWKGIEGARKIYEKFKKSGSLPLEVIKKMIRMEKAQVRAPIDNLRKYFEDGVREFGSTKPDIWVDYMKLERDHKGGDPSQVSALYWRAKKSLIPEAVNELQTLTADFATHGSPDL